MSELIPKTNSELIEQRPSYLANREPPTDKLAEASQHVQPPRVKFIQALTGEPFKPPFAEADCILVPQMRFLCDRSTPMTFTVLNFWVEYCAFNPNSVRGKEPFVRERSFDRNSELAKRCEVFYNEKHPSSDGTIRYRKTRNFMILIHDIPEIKDMPVAMSFKSGQAGQKLIFLWTERRADWFACRFRGAVITEKSGNNFWHSLAPENDVQPFNNEEDFLKYEKVSLQFDKLIQSRQLVVDHDDSDLEGSASEERRF